MKKRVLTILCAVFILVAFCLNSVMVINAERQREEFDSVKAISSDKDKLAVSLSALYKRASDIVLALPQGTVMLCQTAMLKEFGGKTDAKAYLDSRADDKLTNAYNGMDAIIADYKRVMDRYGVGSGSSHRNNCTALANSFSALERASVELVKRARTFIVYADSGYNSYYTAYCEQLQVFSDRLQSTAALIDSNYAALISTVGDMELSLSAAFKQAADVSLALEYAAVNLCQTAVTKIYTGNTTDEINMFFNPVVQGELATSKSNTDSVLAYYDGVLSKYGAPKDSVYRTKRVALSGKFTAIKDGVDKLVTRTRNLINTQTSANYNNYISTMTSLYNSFETAHKEINNEYYSLISKMLGSDYELVSQ